MLLLYKKGPFIHFNEKRMKHIKILFLLLLTLLTASASFAAGNGNKKILIVVQGSSNLRNHAIGDARQLAALLGHFQADVSYKGMDDYKPRELNSYDYTFYIGFFCKRPRTPEVY